MSEFIREVPRSHAFIPEYGDTVSASALDILNQGMVLMGACGRVSMVNRAARALINQRDGLRLEGQRLRFSDAAANDRFDRLVDRAISGEPDRGTAGDWVVPVKRPSGCAPYHVVVSALSGFSPEGSPGVAVLIDDPESVLRPGAGALRILFRLTVAEERVAVGLLAGKTLEEIARDQSVSKETVRAQLREIFAKTGVNRQSELMRILSHTAITARCA